MIDRNTSRVSGSARIPSGVWALGFVSLFMDMSSELVHSMLPLLLVTGLGASALALGVIEGVAEATAMIVKVFSGTLSDFLRRRKLLVVAGYGMAALTKPLFALAPTVGWIFTARFLDRVGKGIRGAPRDALIADLTPAEVRGAAFGLRQSLDTVGAVVGPLAAVALLAAFAQDIRLVLWFAAVPAVIAMLILVVAVREPARPEEERAVRSRFARGDLHSRIPEGGIDGCLVEGGNNFIELPGHGRGFPIEVFRRLLSRRGSTQPRLE